MATLDRGETFTQPFDRSRNTKIISGSTSAGFSDASALSLVFFLRLKRDFPPNLLVHFLPASKLRFLRIFGRQGMPSTTSHARSPEVVIIIIPSAIQVGTFAKWREGKCNASRTFFLHPLKKVYFASRFMSYASALKNDERNVMKRLLLSIAF